MSSKIVSPATYPISDVWASVKTEADNRPKPVYAKRSTYIDQLIRYGKKYPYPAPGFYNQNKTDK